MKNPNWREIFKSFIENERAKEETSGGTVDPLSIIGMNDASEGISKEEMERFEKEVAEIQNRK